MLGMLIGDADLCASVYAPSACVVPPDRRARYGRDEIRALWQQVIDAGGRGDAVITESVDVGTDQIVERGVYARFNHPVALGAPIARGSYLVVAEPQPDGSLAWVADAWTETEGVLA
jgi:ketosteroid isomerase-like protein